MRFFARLSKQAMWQASSTNFFFPQLGRVTLEKSAILLLRKVTSTS